MRGRTGMDHVGSGGWKELGGVECGETYQDLFFEKKSVFNKRKIHICTI